MLEITHYPNEDLDIMVAQQLGLERLTNEAYTRELDTHTSDLVKINIPESMKAYLTGNGEGCFAFFIDVKDLEDYRDNVAEKSVFVILCNDSVFIPPLRSGSAIRVELRGSQRPVLDVYWLAEIVKAQDSSVNLIELMEESND